jgi:hypothetical protein
MFYELYNLPKGHKYRTDVTFTTTETNPFAKLLKSKNKTTLTFDGEAGTDDVVQELRTLVPEVDPGKVEVTVKVTDLSNQQSATKSETLWILPAQTK